MFSFDASLLTSYYNARAGIASGSGSSVSGTGSSGSSAKSLSPTGTGVAPKAPWSYGSEDVDGDKLVSKVLQGQKFIKPNALTSSVAGASEDYNKLFTLYQGLSALEGIAQKVQDGKLSTTALMQAQRRFSSGMEEVGNYVQDTAYDHLDLVQGALTEKLKSTVGFPRTDASYVTDNIHMGTATTSVRAFEGDVKFSVSVKRTGTATPFTVNIDLDDMGTQTRSMSNVVAYINSKFKEQGLQTKFEVNRTPGTPLTSTVNGKTVTLSKGQDTFGLKIKGQSTEVLTFSAPSTADSVYVLQAAGDADKKTTTTKSTNSTTTSEDGETKTDPLVVNQLIKFQTDVTTSGDALDAPISKVGDKYWVEGESGQSTLEDTVKTIHASAAGPDGSLYVLADVEGPVSGQELKGTQDVALIKYDSAGNIVFTRTLGASDSASGLALSVADDGKVAIAGSVTGALNIGVTETKTYGSGSSTATSTATKTESLNGYDTVTKDTFVAVFDSSGVEQWTQRRGATGEDEATSVAFGDDGSVYVGGKTRTAMQGAGVSQAGGYDAYLMGFSAEGDYQFSRQTGTSGTDSTAAVTVDGTTLYQASVENSEIVLRSYDVSGSSPTLLAERKLGGIGGGSISSIAIQDGKLLIGGSTGNGNLLSSGTVTKTYSGGTDAFAASVDTTLSDTGSDTIAYYGGAGGEKDAKVVFSDGKAWISGMTTGEIDGTTKKSTKDAYLARLNIDTGDVEYQTRYTGKDGIVQPASIAVSSGGASVLDRLGLPMGTVEYKDDTRLTSGSSVRTGDMFYVQDSSGAKKKVVIDAKETLETLAKKIIRASGYRLKVEVTKVLGKPESQLQITPNNKSSKVELIAGPVGQNALSSLGIDEGLISSDATKIMDAKASDYLTARKSIGLNFETSLNLSGEANVKKAIESLQGTIKTVQRAYTYLKYGDPQETDTKKKTNASGSVPSYLTDKISNYQSALARLTAGS